MLTFKKLFTGCTIIAAALLLVSCATEPKTVDFTGSGDVSVKQIQQEAELAHRYGRTGGALFHYEQILKKEPDNINALQASGYLYLSLNKASLAEQFFQQVLIKQPKNRESREGRALAWLMQGKYDEAATSFRNVLDEDDKRWRSWDGLGVISDVNGDYTNSVKMYKHAIDLQPNNTTLLNNYGYSLIMAHKYAEAEKTLRTALTIAQGDKRIVNNLGITLSWQRKYDNAVSVVSQVEPKYVAYNNVGYIALLNKDYKIAEKYFNEAITLSPKYYKKAELNLEELKQRVRDNK